MDWWENGENYGRKSSSNSSKESMFWPVEHPNEPQDEDQPIKCPNPHPSLLNVCSEEEQFLNFQRNRPETSSSSSMLNKEETEPRARPVRKRHHNSSRRKEKPPNPSLAPPRHSFSAHDNLKIFPMFRNFYKES